MIEDVQREHSELETLVIRLCKAANVGYDIKEQGIDRKVVAVHDQARFLDYLDSTPTSIIVPALDLLTFDVSSLTPEAIIDGMKVTSAEWRKRGFVEIQIDYNGGDTED